MVGLIQKLFARPALDPARLRRAKPIRHPGAELEAREDGLVLVRVPVAKSRWPWAKGATHRTFELEAIGAFVWGLCDGERTVEGITHALREQFKLNRVEAEAALVAFLQTLSRRGLITLMMPETAHAKRRTHHRH